MDTKISRKYEHPDYAPKPADFVPEPTFPEGHKWAGQKRCRAWSSNHGRQCNKTPARGKLVCRMHGGATPTGAALPQYKTGRYSRYLPSRLLDKYNQASQDADLLQLRDEIALIDSRLQDVLSHVDVGEAGSLWKEAKKTFAEMEMAQIASDAQEFIAKKAKLNGLLMQGSDDYTAWEEIKSLVRIRQSLVESERKRVVEMQLMIDGAEVFELVKQFMLVVRSNITDPGSLAKIQGEFTRLMSRP